MKKVIFVFALLSGLTLTVNAQTAPKKESTTKLELLPLSGQKS